MIQIEGKRFNVAIHDKALKGYSFIDDKYELMYRIIKHYPQQKEVYFIQDFEKTPDNKAVSSLDLEREQLNYIENFGMLSRFNVIYKAALEGRKIDYRNLEDTIEREYVLIIPNIEDRTIESFTKAINDFREEYLPANAVPKYYMDENKYSTSIEFEEYRALVTDMFEGIILTNRFSELYSAAISANIYKEDMRKTISDIDERDLFDITSYVDSLHKLYSGSNVDTHNKFFQCVKEIMERSTDKTIIHYTGDNTDIYLRLAAYLTYYHNAVCYVSAINADLYQTYICDLFYNPSTMLVEDRVNYLCNYPTFAYRGFRGGYGLSYVATSATFVKGKCFACDLPILRGKSIDQLFLKEEVIPSITSDNVNMLVDINFKSLKLIPILELFPLNTDNAETNSINEKMLYDIIVRFEKILRNYSISQVDIFDLFFIENGDMVTMCYLDKLDFKTSSVLISDMLIKENKTPGGKTYYKGKDAILAGFSLNEDTARSYLPVDILEDKNAVLSKIYFCVPYFAPPKLQKALLKVSDAEITKIPNRHALKLTSKYYTPFVLFSRNLVKKSLEGVKPNEEFYLNCFNSFSTHCRSKAFKHLLDSIDIDYSRKENLIDIYGAISGDISSVKRIDSNYLVGGI